MPRCLLHVTPHVHALVFTCSFLAAGWVLTPLVEAQIQARAKEAGVPREKAAEALLSEKQPSKTFATPAEIGELTAFLCGAHAGQITGESIGLCVGVPAAVRVATSMGSSRVCRRKHSH
jgi:NAD(P)-dependent dehydrogenase (short-subunit alcohol dehydrogenase family)